MVLMVCHPYFLPLQPKESEFYLVLRPVVDFDKVKIIVNAWEPITALESHRIEDIIVYDYVVYHTMTTTKPSTISRKK